MIFPNKTIEICILALTNHDWLLQFTRKILGENLEKPDNKCFVKYKYKI